MMFKTDWLNASPAEFKAACDAKVTPEAFVNMALDAYIFAENSVSVHVERLEEGSSSEFLAKVEKLFSEQFERLELSKTMGDPNHIFDMKLEKDDYGEKYISIIFNW